MSATQTMGWTTLIAPADGVVTAVNGVVGQTVSGSGVSASSGSTTSVAASSSSFVVVLVVEQFEQRVHDDHERRRALA